MTTTDHRLATLRQLAQPGASILFVVLDGVADLPMDGATALDKARTPNLDDLSARSNLGLIDPVDRGITPGSGLGHLSLFGYDVYRHRAERGVLEALGVGLPVNGETVAVRGNFVSLDAAGKITDRRAGRMASDEGKRVVAKLAAAIPDIDGVPVELRLIKEYRFSLVLHDESLGGHVADTDPQQTGVPPLATELRSATLAEEADPAAAERASHRTCELLARFAERAREVLADEQQANGVTLRGIGKRPAIPTFDELYGMRGVAIANYPMYRGAGALVGMDTVAIEGEGECLDAKVDAVRRAWGEYDFVFMHVKKTDSAGEDGDQAAKQRHLEAFDAALPRLLELAPPVVGITGDHSTPALLKSHSWHPVPVLVHGPAMAPCPAARFTEAEAQRGALGRFRGLYLLGELLAQAGRLKKFGA